MRILTLGNRLAPWSIGGYERSWASAIAHLRASGHSVRVLSTLPDPTDVTDAPPADPATFRELRWYWRAHVFPPLAAREVLELEWGNRRVLTRHLREFRPDVVLWAAMGGMSLSLIEQVRRARLPAAGIVGDEWFAYGPQVDAWARYWRGRRRALAPLAERVTGVPARLALDRAARWIFHSHHLQRAAARAGWETSGTTVIPTGVDAPRFPPAAGETWRGRLLVCGRLDPRKGVEVALEALAELGTDASLRIHGDGEAAYLAELRRQVVARGLAGQVGFSSSGFDGVPPVIAGADAFLFPVLWQEPFGIAPLEAMAVGRPVVASALAGGPAEYLREGENCLLFAPGDAQGLAACVRRLTVEPELRRLLVEGGRRTAARFTEAAFNAGLLAELERIAGP